jgi:hypothetical protein
MKSYPSAAGGTLKGADRQINAHNGGEGEGPQSTRAHAEKRRVHDASQLGVRRTVQAGSICAAPFVRKINPATGEVIAVIPAN